MKVVYQDMVVLLRERPFFRTWAWVVENRFLLAAVFAGLLTEAVLLALLASAGMAGWVAVGAFFFSLMWLCYALSIGAELKGTPDGSVGKVGRIEDHVFYVRLMTAALLVGVVAIEVSIRKAGGLWGPWWLMLLHFTMVAASTLTFVSTLMFNGVADKERHRVWAPRFAWCYLGTIGTGTALLILRFPLA